MGAPRIGHRNSPGTSSSSFLAGDGGTGTSAGGLCLVFHAGGGVERKDSSFQRRARSAPIRVAGAGAYQLDLAAELAKQLLLVVQRQ
uniref:Uncharacterized protein n=1 Tax=Arundo donax TaxID=35708 RepID=A0A0A9DZX9_ARUDO